MNKLPVGFPRKQGGQVKRYGPLYEEILKFSNNFREN